MRIWLSDPRKPLCHIGSLLAVLFCVFSLELQFLEINNLVNNEDFSAIADTIRAVNIAVFVLISVTIILNILAGIYQKKKS